jgi:hypothetical protein
MKERFTTIVLASGLALGAAAVRADSTIAVRLSYKVILNPDNGTRPPGVTDAGIDAAIAEMNTIMPGFGRGYRYARAGPVTNIGSVGGVNRPNPSHYYDVDFSANPAEKDHLLADAQSHPNLYAWDDNAVNIFVAVSPGISFCFTDGSSSDAELLVINAGRHDDGRTHIHEIGHFMGLCHTQGCGCTSCEQGCDSPESDNVPDTLSDLQCWDQDDIAANNFLGLPYDLLTPAQQTQVDNVFFNVMSYHHVDTPTELHHSRETELQLDRWVDRTRSAHPTTVDGITAFVDASAVGIPVGTSQFPFRTVALGLSLANSGRDLVLIRPGAYPENLTIHDPVTLRAPRTGRARIGAP